MNAPSPRASWLQYWAKAPKTLRYATLWFVSASILAIWAGPRRFSWSSNDHFNHLAHAYAQGQWTHPKDPPGYCSPAKKRAGKCRDHRFDDWARYAQLELDISLAQELKLPTKLRANRCATKRCQQDPARRAHRWWIPGRGLVDLRANAYRVQERRWFVSFPPGPAIFFLLPLLLSLPLPPDIPLVWMLAATIPPSLDLALTSTRFGPPALPRSLLALAALFATPLWSLAIQGQVWFLAQVSFIAASALGLALWGPRARAQALTAGLFAFALACRPSGALGLFGGLAILLASEQRGLGWPQRMRRSWPLLLPCAMALLLAAWNWKRFGDPFEFGHAFLQVRWQERIQERGLFSWSYLYRNISCFLWQPPRLSWLPRISIHGLGWLFGSPWILWASSAPPKSQRHLLGAALLVLLPALFYQNSGQLQTSYRFALDALPLWIIAIAASKRLQGRIAKITLVWALLVNGTLAWMWLHEFSDLFVFEPRGWPWPN